MSIAVRCAPLGARLKALRGHRIDLMILDVEGAEHSCYGSKRPSRGLGSLRTAHTD